MHEWITFGNKLKNTKSLSSTSIDGEIPLIDYPTLAIKQYCGKEIFGGLPIFNHKVHKKKKFTGFVRSFDTKDGLWVNDSYKEFDVAFFYKGTLRFFQNNYPEDNNLNQTAQTWVHGNYEVNEFYCGGVEEDEIVPSKIINVKYGQLKTSKQRTIHSWLGRYCIKSTIIQNYDDEQGEFIHFYFSNYLGENENLKKFGNDILTYGIELHIALPLEEILIIAEKARINPVEMLSKPRKLVKLLADTDGEITYDGYDASSNKPSVPGSDIKQRLKIEIVGFKEGFEKIESIRKNQYL